MQSTQRGPISSKNFSVAFERMCNFVAISRTENSEGTLRELILQCFAILPDEKFNNVTDIAKIIVVLFGLDIPQADIEIAIEKLMAENSLSKPLGTFFVIDEKVKTELDIRIVSANMLELRVRSYWFDELKVDFPNLPHEKAWRALRGYLGRLFRRHGIQAVAYLDMSLVAPEEYINGLTSLLEAAIKEVFQKDDPNIHDAERAITAFLAAVGKNVDRVTYITQLADGAFNYYSLMVDPEVAKNFRENLRPLTLFLDTNFLYGILDLSANPLVDVSHQLMASIKKFDLPFTLYYHPATQHEFATSIKRYGDRLISRHWSPVLSRAALATRSVTGPELKYHEENAVNPVKPNEFLAPYAHFDVLLSDHDIEKFPSEYDPDEQHDDNLVFQYRDYFAQKKRHKADALIDHDVTVLREVLNLRSTASTSSLDVTALLLTCDYNLYKFAFELSRRKNERVGVLLPNLFMQMLRPFLPSNADFDRSFAETFAIPEFRTIGSGAAQASSKLLGLLATYANVSEQAATSLLTNDLLLEKLEPIEDDAEFAELVEAEIISDNNALLEERAALEEELEAERQRRHSETLSTQQRLSVMEEALTQEKTLKSDALKSASQELQEKRAAIETIEHEKQAREEVERALANAKEHNTRMEAQLTRLLSVAVVAICIGIAISVFGLLEGTKLLEALNPKQYGSIDIFVSGFVACALLGVFKPKWRTFCWGGIALTILVAFIQLIHT